MIRFSSPITRWAARVVAIGILAACHHNGPRGAVPLGPPDAPVADITGLLVPRRVDSFTMTTTESFPDSSAGTLYRYSDGSAANVSVILYGVPADVRRGDAPQAWVGAESAKYRAVIPVMIRRGWYDDIRMAFEEDQPLAVDSVSIPGFAVGAASKRAGKVSVELQYLYLVDGIFVKVRATVPGQTWQDTTVPSFAKDLVAMVVRNDIAHARTPR
jgi:hypothetical protein